MDAAVRPSAKDIHQLLARKVAYVSGGEVEGLTLITIPQHSFHAFLSLEQVDLRKLFAFLIFTSSCRKESPSYTVLANLRGGDWAQVKPFLKKLELTLPPGVETIFLIPPSSMLSLSKYAVKSKLDEWSFKIVECGMKSLLNHIPAAELTEEFQGTLVYNHEHWVDLQLWLDTVCANYREGLSCLKFLQDDLRTLAVPSCSSQAHSLTESMKMKAKNDKAAGEEAIQSANRLLSAMRDVPCRWRLSTKTAQFAALGSMLENSIAEIKLIFREVDRLWVEKERELKMAHESLLICEQMQVAGDAVMEHLKKLASLEMSLGDSYSSASQLRDEHAAFTIIAKDDLQSIHSTQMKGREYKLTSSWQERVTQSVLKWEEECSKLADKLQRRLELLDNSVMLYGMLERGEALCNEGYHQLAVQPIDVCLSEDDTSQSVSELEGLKRELVAIDVDPMKSLSGDMPPLLAVVRRVSDFADHRNSLIKILDQRVAGIQTMSMRHSALKEQLQQHAERDSTGSLSDFDPDNVQIVVSSTPEDSTGNSLDGRHIGRATPLTSLKDDETDPKVLEKRKYIAAELVDTERVYINDLRSVIEAYWSAMDSSNDKLPASLVGKQNIIFGNLPRIFDFHEKVFLQTLESCVNNPVALGFLFLKQERNFQMYIGYCKNKPRSETFLKECDPTFFEDIRQAHGFRLSLETYLIKPVQRITKYQLLLKDMMKNCEKSPRAHEALQGALTSMLSIVEYVNNVMHSIGIVGFPGSLLEQGQLLLQDTFQVLKGTGSRLMRLKIGAEHSRQVFLYEQAVIISKRKDQTTGDRQAMYTYKDMIKMAEVALTENTKDDQTRFQVAHFKHDKVYTLQARNTEIKQAWVAKIRELLEEQLVSIQNLRKCEEGLLTLRNRSSRGDLKKSLGLSLDIPTISSVPQATNTPEGSSSISSACPGGHSEGSSAEEDVEQQTRKELTSGEDHICVVVGDFDNEQGDPSHLSLKAGDSVQVLEFGHEGWWRVKLQGGTDEGWVPSNLLRQISDI